MVWEVLVRYLKKETHKAEEQRLCVFLIGDRGEDREKYGQLSEDAGELISKYCRVDFKKYSDEEVIPMGSVSENFQKIFIRFLFVVKRTINN